MMMMMVIDDDNDGGDDVRCVYGRGYVCPALCRGVLVLSFYLCVSFRDQTQVPRLALQVPLPAESPTGPRLAFLS